MSNFRVSMFTALVCSSLAFAACGGGGDDSSNNDTAGDADDSDDVTLPDARPDGTNTTPDSPTNTEITGIGHDCTASTDCDTGLACLTFTAGGGYCTAACIQSGSFMTDANAAFTTTTPALETGDATCASKFTATVGSSECFQIVNVMPAPNANGTLNANTAYTFVGACGVSADADMNCPGNLVYNAMFDECVPQ